MQFIWMKCVSKRHIYGGHLHTDIYLLSKTFSKVLEQSSHVKYVNHWLISDLKQKMSFGVSWGMAIKNIVPIIIISIQLV